MQVIESCRKLALNDPQHACSLGVHSTGVLSEIYVDAPVLTV